MAKAEVKKQCMRYFQIFLGCFIVCMGFNLFLIQAHLLTGGLSGVALIIYYLTGIPVGMQNLVYNLPVIYLAYRVFGRLYAVDTILGTVILSVIWDATAFLQSTVHITGDIMLNAIFGGVLAGIGFGLIFRSNANTGGLDVVGAVVKKFWSIDVGTVIFVLNFVIVALGVYFNNDYTPEACEYTGKMRLAKKRPDDGEDFFEEIEEGEHDNI